MNKQEIKEQLKTLAIDIKDSKRQARKHVDYYGPQAEAQSALVKESSQVRGLLIAYAYLNGKPFTAPEKNAFNEHDSDQQSAVIKAKAALGLTEVRVYPSMTVHKPLPDEQFDKWLKNTSGSGRIDT